MNGRASTPDSPMAMRSSLAREMRLAGGSRPSWTEPMLTVIWSGVRSTIRSVLSEAAQASSRIARPLTMANRRSLGQVVGRRVRDS